MFTHLHLHSPYSFQDGGSSIETLVSRAADLGMPALALTDHNSVTAAVKFTQICEAYTVRPILGAELYMEDGSHLTLLVQNPTGYANLCRLLTKAFYHGGRLSPGLPWQVLLADPAALSDLICLSGCRKGRIPSLIRNHRYDAARELALNLRDYFGRENFFLELQCDFIPKALRVSRDLVELGAAIGVEVTATNNVHFATPDDAIAHEALRCIATGTRVDQIHIDRPLNAERFLKSHADMTELFAWCPRAIKNTEVIAERCGKALPDPQDVTPSYPVPERHGCCAMEYLRRMTELGAKHRRRLISEGLRKRLDYELSVIERLDFADYFLICWDMVRWCRKPEQNILATVRGSGVDCEVLYDLGISHVSAYDYHLPFARFMALAEGLNAPKLPDIDIDFPNSKRDHVFRYVLEQYGEGHVAQVCTYSTFWARSAIRDIGKALRLPPQVLTAIGSNLHHWVATDQIDATFERPELKPHAHLKEPCQQLFELCGRIAGFPRHLSKHSSGVIISRVPLDTIGIISPQASGVLPVLMYDKEDAPELGLLKVDILALGIHSAIADTEAEINKRTTGKKITYNTIPANDRETYKMIRAGAAVGTFQAESAAERAYAVKLGPEHIDDLAAIIAQIRPGPVRSGVTKEFIAVRNGYKRQPYIPPDLVPVLGPTHGLVVYQEQVVAVIAWMWKSSEAEADRFRKSLARHDKLDTMDKAKNEFVQRSLQARPEFSFAKCEMIFEKMIATWCSYGFTQGHARAFADIAYKSAYLSVHEAAAFFAGLLSNQPMGYYAPMTLATEARWRGVEVLPVDINESFDNCTTEEKVIRLGLRLATGLRQEDIDAIVAERAKGPFSSLLDFCSRVTLHRDRLETLILCGAFDCLHERHRKGILWTLPETVTLARSYKGERHSAQGAFSWPVTHLETPIAWDVSRFSEWEDYVLTWRLTGVGPGCHPFAFLRPALKHLGVMPIEEVQSGKSAKTVRTAGLNIRPHMPPTREGRRVLYTVFEDEKRHLQASCAGDALECCIRTLITSPAVIAKGPVFRSGSGWTMQIEEVEPISMTRLVQMSQEIEGQRRTATSERTAAVDGARGEWHMGYNVATRPKSLSTVGKT